jgi:hypothetical protein
MRVRKEAKDLRVCRVDPASRSMVADDVHVHGYEWVGEGASVFSY